MGNLMACGGLGVFVEGYDGQITFVTFVHLYH